MKIIPTTLKHFRKRNSMSQADLALATEGNYRVSISTIKRIESAKSDYEANPRIAKKLADVLGMKPEDLAKEAKDLKQDKEDLQKLGMRTLKTVVDEETALSYQTVEHLYGIPMRSQILMAPLFAALLAEQSLAWRRDKLAKIDDAVGELRDQATGHLSFANLVYRVEEASAEESLSIVRRDLFGMHVADDAFEGGFDPSANNPFADYLRELVSEIESDSIVLDPDGLGFWKTHEQMPEYTVGKALVEQVTDDDTWAEFALKRGYARIADIPENLMADDAREARITWLANKIPLAARKEREEYLAQFADLF